MPARQLEPGPDDHRQWIPIAVAAERLGVDRHHLARQCRNRLQAEGLATQMTPIGGGNQTWHIHVRYDLRLHDGALGRAHRLPDLSQFTKAEQEAARARLACLKAFRAARLGNDARYSGNMRDWLPLFIEDHTLKFPGIRISRSRLYDWDANYGGDADFINLLDKRGGDRNSAAAHANRKRLWAFFKDVYLSDRQPTVRQAWKQTLFHAERHDLADNWCSYGQCARTLDQHIPPALAMRYREPGKYRDRLAPRIEGGATQNAEPGRHWQGDHAQCDFMVWYQDSLIRPWVTAWIDVGTRRIVGAHLVVSPNSDTVLACFGDAMRDPANMGGPHRVRVDNGKDYKAWYFDGKTRSMRQRLLFGKGEHVDEPQFTGIYGWLDIEVGFTIPRNPTGKSTIERWFGTMHARFCKSFISYCGARPQDRPEALTAILKRGREVPLFADAAQRLADFVAAYNADADHSIDVLRVHPGRIPGADGRLSPDEAMRRGATRIVPRDPDAIDLVCQHWYKPVTVGKYGVTIHPLGTRLRYGMTNPALFPYKAVREGRKKERVLVSYDPEDLRSVRVYTLSGKFITTARSNNLGDLPGAVGREELSKLKREITRYNRAVKHVRNSPHRSYQTAEELLHAAALDKQAREQLIAQATGTDDVAPAPIQVRQTPLDGAPRAVRTPFDAPPPPAPGNPGPLGEFDDDPEPLRIDFGVDHTHDEDDDPGFLDLGDLNHGDSPDDDEPGCDGPLDLALDVTPDHDDGEDAHILDELP